MQQIIVLEKVMKINVFQHVYVKTFITQSTVKWYFDQTWWSLGMTGGL